MLPGIRYDTCFVLFFRAEIPPHCFISYLVHKSLPTALFCSTWRVWRGVLPFFFFCCLPPRCTLSSTDTWWAVYIPGTYGIFIHVLVTCIMLRPYPQAKPWYSSSYFCYGWPIFFIPRVKSFLYSTRYIIQQSTTDGRVFLSPSPLLASPAFSSPPS